jgi:hypothetical protein
MMEFEQLNDVTKKFIYKNLHKIQAIGLEEGDMLSECFIKFSDIQKKYQRIPDDEFIQLYSKSISNMLKDMRKKYFAESRHLDRGIDIYSDQELLSDKAQDDMEMALFISQIPESDVKNAISYIVKEGLDKVSNEELEKELKIKPKWKNGGVVRIKTEIKDYLEKNFI